MTEPRPISIWEPRQVEGELAFVRPSPSPFGDHYADVPLLRARKAPGRLRICVFGESVAAGYLYAPHLTAASALAAWLAELAGPAAYEVVDLARTNETLAGLAGTVEAALQLAPDLLVLFAGNNWNLLETPEVSPYSPAPAQRRDYAAALDQAGVPGPVGLARRRLHERATGALDRIAAAAREAGVPVVAAIPEVNLADWETRQPVTWLGGDGVGRWYGLLATALAALERGDAAAAEEAAWRMNRLDGSSGPVPFRLMARAWAAAGRSTDARDAALAEVDGVHYPLLAFLAAPQATTAARTLLAEAARRHGWSGVDLREVFARHTGSPLPGRRLFLDYCHLTSEGLAAAMAAVAVEVVRRAPAGGGAREVEWPELLAAGGGPAVSAAVEATARLGAALHGAHRHLPLGRVGPHLEDWCAEALALSPAVAETVLELAEARAAPCPAGLTAAVRRNLASAHPLGFQHGLQWAGLDADFFLAAGAALRRAQRPEVAAEVERLLVGGGIGRPGPGGLDLAQGRRWLGEPLARFFPEAIDASEAGGRAALRCPWPETSFWLPVTAEDAAAGVTLGLTARLPPIPGAEGTRRGRVEVRVDGEAVGGLPLGERWGRGALRLPRERLRPGLRRIALAWPMPPPVGEAALDGARRRLERGIEADLHPVFGEVFSLRARTARAG